MNEDQTEGVTEETTEASPAENQSEVSQESQTDQSGSSEEKEEEQKVPYERFAQVNSKTKALEEELKTLKEKLESKEATRQSIPQTQADLAKQQQEALIKEQLKQMGFVSQEEIRQIEADRELNNKLSSLEAKYNGKDGKPKFNKLEVLEFARDRQIGDVEDAFKLMNYDSFLSMAAKQATTTNKPVKSETSDGSGSSEAGTTNSDLIKAARSGDKSSLNSFIKRLIK